MKFAISSTLITLLLSGLAAASPAGKSSKRATFCGDWGSQQIGDYTVYNNLWGKSAATSGSQCTTVNGVSSGSLSWSVSWTWQGGSYNVKSYPNAVLSSTPRALSSISNMDSTWKWTYTGSSIVANVAYDLFTSSTPSGSPQYEIMIWLAALGGAGPISATGSPVATPTLAGRSWRLFKGVNGAMTVFSFVATSQQASFSGNLKEFVNYLNSNQGLPTSQYLNSLGAGTEPFTGSNAVFTTSAFSARVA